MMGTQETADIRVWDPFVRITHWTIAVGFFVAYFTEDEALTLHVWAGYTIGVLVALRVFWGVMGPRYARFADFVYAPPTVVTYLVDLLRARAKRYVGYSPAGGAMVVTLLLALATTVVTGLLVYVEEEHEVIANLTLVLVVAHILGVILASVVHRENLLRAMVTSRKRADGVDELTNVRP